MLRIEPDGAEFPLPGGGVTVSALQDIVGGFIEVADTDSGVLVFDVDGAAKDKLYNGKATLLLNRPGEFVAGTAVLVPPGMIRPD